MRRAAPPFLAVWLLTVITRSADREALLGDLAEGFQHAGARRMWYWRQTVASIGPLLRERLRRRPEHAPLPTTTDHSMRTLLADVRRAFRSLLARPGFASATVLSLALGIGANALIFSIVDALVLHPYPYPELDRLVGVGSAFPRLNRELGYLEVHSAPEFSDVRAASRTLEHVVAFDLGHRQLAGEDAPVDVFSAFWWGDAFPTMGLPPALGRGFREEEIRRQEHVAVISHRLWVSRFGKDPDILGKTLLVNGAPYAIVGVMPQRLLVFGTDLWLPMWAAPEDLPRDRRQLQILGRIRPASTLDDVNAELGTLARRTDQRYGAAFEEYHDWELRAATWADINSQQFRPAGLILLGAVAFVLLLVSANVANLVLVRVGGRRRELAVRTALGAARARLIQHLMAEHLLLALAGGAAGLALAAVGLPLLSAAIPVGLPTGAELAINLRVVIFAAVLALVSVFLFGLLPTLQSSRLDPQQILQSESGQSTGSRGTRRLQRLFVTAEVALAMILLTGAGLLARSFGRLHAVDPGFDTGRALMFRITLPAERYRHDAIRPFFRELARRVATVPGVSGAALASQLPPRIFSQQRIRIEGVRELAGGSLPSSYLTLVSPDFFQNLGIPLLRGRVPDARDLPGTPIVAVVNEAAAERFFPGQDPIGQRFRIGDSEQSGWIQIIGIVGSVHNRGLDRPPAPEIYGSTDQVPLWNQLYLVARTTGDPRAILPAVRAEVRALDADLPVYAIQTVAEAFADSVAQQRLAASALVVFAGLALALAAMGVYGIVSYGVSRRTREIGVRVALGARQGEVRRLIVRQALIPVGIGFSLGLAGALALGQVLRSLMFEISPTDPATIAATTAVLIGAATMASLVPAHRASRLDPVQALRHE